MESNDYIAPHLRNKYSDFSHGESFLELFPQFNEGIFLLDEPESSLSPQNQLALLKIINDLDKDDKSQIIILTHSLIIMTYLYADLLFITEDEIITKK